VRPFFARPFRQLSDSRQPGGLREGASHRYNGAMTTKRAELPAGWWVVIAIVLLGVTLALLALKFRVDLGRKPAAIPSTLPIAQDVVDQAGQH
jgi:hypothetical protein